MNARERALAVRAVEALEDGDKDTLAATLLELVTEDASGAQPRTFACPRCPATFNWPGERDAHIGRVHGWEDEVQAA